MRNSASCREPVSTVIPGERLIHLVGKLPDLDCQSGSVHSGWSRILPFCSPCMGFRGITLSLHPGPSRQVRENPSSGCDRAEPVREVCETEGRVRRLL